MALTIPWLNSAKSRAGRVSVAMGPDGLALAHITSAGRLAFCAFYEQQGDPARLLADAVAEQDWQGLPCSVVLHPVYYQLLLSERPEVQGSELSSAVRWKVKELLDFPLEEAAIEYFLLPDDAYRGRQKMLYAAALRKATLQGLVEPVEASGLAVDTVEVTELALHNLVARLPAEAGGLALLQLHEGEGFINLVDDGAIYLTRRLDFGLAGFNRTGDNTQFLDTLYLEIQRSLDFFESQLGKGIITRLYYSPGLDEVSAIGEFLTAQLGMHVARLDITALQLVEGEMSESMIRCASAIGAALGPGPLAEASRAAS